MLKPTRCHPDSRMMIIKFLISTRESQWRSQLEVVVSALEVCVRHPTTFFVFFKCKIISLLSFCWELDGCELNPNSWRLSPVYYYFLHLKEIYPCVPLGGLAIRWLEINTVKTHHQETQLLKSAPSFLWKYKRKLHRLHSSLISSLRNYQLYILNFPDPINSLVEMTLKLKAWLWRLK